MKYNFNRKFSAQEIFRIISAWTKEEYKILLSFKHIIMNSSWDIFLIGSFSFIFRN